MDGAVGRCQVDYAVHLESRLTVLALPTRASSQIADTRPIAYRERHF